MIDQMFFFVYVYYFVKKKIINQMFFFVFFNIMIVQVTCTQFFLNGHWIEYLDGNNIMLKVLSKKKNVFFFREKKIMLKVHYIWCKWNELEFFKYDIYLIFFFFMKVTYRVIQSETIYFVKKLKKLRPYTLFWLKQRPY